MKNQADRKSISTSWPGSRRATANLWLVLIVAGILAAVGSWFYLRQTRQPVVAPIEFAAPGVVLSESTMRILGGLETTIELRLFAPGDSAALSADLGAYLMRVENLLAEYERIAAGKLRLIKTDPQTDKAAKALAVAAGVVPFAGENGEIVYLGLMIANGSRQEAIVPLAPEWEAALESDVSRAIVRVTAKIALATSTVSSTSPATVPIDPAISEELLRTLPNLASQTFDEAAKILREQTLEEFKMAVTEMQSKVSLAQKALAEAQANKNAAAQQEALQAFQAVQAEQADKLKGITARLQERITVLERLKTAPPSSAAAPQP